MEIQINTANNLEVHQATTDQPKRLSGEFFFALRGPPSNRRASWAADETDVRSDNDIGCQIEARPRPARQPVVTVREAQSIERRQALLQS
jgi:hypothetical protein